MVIIALNVKMDTFYLMINKLVMNYNAYQMNGNRPKLWNALNVLIHYNIAFNARIVINVRLANLENI